MVQSYIGKNTIVIQFYKRISVGNFTKIYHLHAASAVADLGFPAGGTDTPSKLLVRMSLICTWAILYKEYLEPNLSIF